MMWSGVGPSVLRPVCILWYKRRRRRRQCRPSITWVRLSRLGGHGNFSVAGRFWIF